MGKECGIMLPQSKDASHRHAPKALPPSGTSLELATLCVVRWQDTALLIFFFTELWDASEIK
jgi:hypothetical protein